VASIPFLLSLEFGKKTGFLCQVTSWIPLLVLKDEAWG
jgi:hypothetical protein